ncbi:hypothetical protein [Natronorubrum daqingense]|uniref:HEAT repeat-containing protein n=1 Tax=Natronorubrum daqingense TaxID=588898 RepID=A0A1N7C9V3_9EURY|nr:hypothetical protein [Natronorubrum daqingense]APX96807.1 hypothetical protein BB347_09340 [Natronorubrum daqingense]SIR60346.1 hypothetical protein SAMN05421809_1591 [Natronorubrum daqingense]
MSGAEISRYAESNTELLSRLLAYGDSESRAYALTVLANSGNVDAIDQVQAELDRIKRELE